MATKAIYTKIDGKYYQVMQDTTNPLDVAKLQKTHTNLNMDGSGKIVNSNIWVNTLESKIVNSNKELYDLMVEELVRDNVLNIPCIQNHYVMYCDYSVFNSDYKEINHNAFVYPISHKDAICALGVNELSELVYKQVKVFDTHISLNVKNEYPMGIMRDSKFIQYRLQINDLAIYQDLTYNEFDEHKSANPTAYPMQEVLKTMVKLYSTHDNGITLNAVEIPFIPKRIVLDINVVLDDLIVAYDEFEVKKILINNISEATGGDGFDGPDDPDPDDEPELTIILDGGGAH